MLVCGWKDQAHIDLFEQRAAHLHDHRAQVEPLRQAPRHWRQGTPRPLSPSVYIALLDCKLLLPVLSFA